MKKGFFQTGVVACLSLLAFSFQTNADEGMFLFNNPPKAELKAKYNFELTDSLLELLQYSSVRFSNGGSGSFVSPQGLIMTNHHIAVSSLQKLSTPQNDLVKNGFYAAEPEQELAVPNLELVLLAGIEDVTAKVNEAVKEDMDFDKAQAARRAVMNTLEKEASEKSGFKCEVISFYQGSVFHLYKYKTFKDVRLVFAPEESVGFFGGEPDNFEYPRYNIDVSFFRAYENGKPFAAPRFLRWSAQGALENDLVFVSGHPGRTNRFDTSDHLMFRRDFSIPFLLNRIRRQEILLQLYAEKNTENARRVSSELFRVRNTRKNLSGVLLGLQTPALLNERMKNDADFFEKAKTEKIIDPEKYDPWDEILKSLGQLYDVYYLYELIEKGSAFNSDLYRIAKNIVRYVDESQKPNEQRLREFQDAALPSVKEQILTSVPIYPDLEIAKLADSFSLYLEYIPEWETDNEQEGDGFNLMAKLSPKDRASKLILQTKLGDVAYRQQLLNSDLDTLKKCEDPMIQFALLVNDLSSEVRQVYESEVDEPMRRAYAKINEIRTKFAKGTTYPDATFTLRLSYGKVAGYTEDDGMKLPPWTTMSGLFQHAREHDNAEPFNLPQTWLTAADKVNPDSPVNLVSTNDIIGGNSGSPLVNGKGEIVGLIFDGNIQSLVSNFIYTEQQGRAISVHSTGIIDALHNVYKVSRIVNELVEAQKQ